MAESTFRKPAKIQTESEAYAYMESLRWPHGPVCPHCGNTEKHYYLKPRKTLTEGVESRRTRTGSHSERRVWKCANKECRKQFSVLTGTIFHGSKVPLVTWLMVVYEMCANKNGIAAREIERRYAVAPKTAWYMTQRIREAMKSNRLMPMVGTIVSDETWIGGDPMNDNHRKPEVAPVPFQPGAQIPNQRSDKTPVVSLINCDTGEVRSQVVARVTGATIRKFMAENIAMEASHLMTDEGGWYDTLGREFGTTRRLTTQSVSTPVVTSASTRLRTTFPKLSGPSTARTITSARSTWPATSPSTTFATRRASWTTRSG